MSPPKPNFVLSRATADDMEGIVDLCYDSFGRDETTLFMGCPDRTNLPKYLERTLKNMQSDKSDVWMQVKDFETGKVVACCNWKIYVNGQPDDVGDRPLDWVDRAQYEKSAEVMNVMNESRRRNMPGPFVHLHICCTHPEYRRMGAGALMMQWGVDMMDSLFVPGWIEASPDGTLLYQTFGFYVFERGEVNGMPVAYMKRDVRSKGIEGTMARK